MSPEIRNGTDVVDAAREPQLVPADLDARAEEVSRQVAEARAQAEAIEVRDEESAALATGVTRQIQKRRKAAEAERKELVGPLNDHVKRINQKFKDAMAPFEEADQIVRRKLQTWTAEQEEKRRAEEERLRKEQEEREAKIRAERERQEAEAKARAEQKAKEAREAEEEARKTEDEEDRKAAEVLAEEARAEAQEAATAESAIASLPEVELPAAVVPAAAKPEGLSTRKRWRLKSVDVTKLDPKYLLANEKELNADMRAGVKENGCPPEIPGAEFEQVDELAVRA